MGGTLLPCVRGTVAELRPWVFCGRMFPMVSLFATELVGVVRIMVGLDGTEIAEGKVLIGAATHTGEASDSDIAD